MLNCSVTRDGDLVSSWKCVLGYLVAAVIVDLPTSLTFSHTLAHDLVPEARVLVAPKAPTARERAPHDQLACKRHSPRHHFDCFGARDSAGAC